MENTNDVQSSTRQVSGELIDDEAEQIKRQMEQLAWLMDESISLPGTKLSLGADALLGLIPGLGDLLSAAISTYILRLAIKLKVPRVVLVRMALNSLIDLLVGTIPVIGDMFDIVWKANRKNVDLVIRHLEDPHKLRQQSWAQVGGLAAITLALILGFSWAVYSMASWLFG